MDLESGFLAQKEERNRRLEKFIKYLNPSVRPSIRERVGIYHRRSRSPRIYGRRLLRTTAEKEMRLIKATKVKTLKHKLQENLHRSSGLGKSRDSVGVFSSLAIFQTETLESKLPDKHTLWYGGLP